MAQAVTYTRDGKVQCLFAVSVQFQVGDFSLMAEDIERFGQRERRHNCIH